MLAIVKLAEIRRTNEQVELTVERKDHLFERNEGWFPSMGGLSSAQERRTRQAHVLWKNCTTNLVPQDGVEQTGYMTIECKTPLLPARGSIDSVGHGSTTLERWIQTINRCFLLCHVKKVMTKNRSRCVQRVGIWLRACWLTTSNVMFAASHPTFPTRAFCPIVRRRCMF
jgi:hypothetical protein